MNEWQATQRGFFFTLIDADGERTEAEGRGYTAADAAFNSTDIFPGEMITEIEEGEKVSQAWIKHEIDVLEGKIRWP